MPPFLPVISGPTEVPLTPSISASKVPVSIPIVRGDSWDPLLREMQVRVSALRKPYLGAPVIVSEGVPGVFYFGRRPTQDQATSCKFAQVSMGTTNVPDAVNVTIGMGEKYENVQKQTRSAPAPILEP